MSHHPAECIRAERVSGVRVSGPAACRPMHSNSDQIEYAQEVKKPPLGVRFDSPEYRLSTPGIAAYTSQGRLRNREDAAMTSLSTYVTSGGLSRLQLM